jgi:hypothetical protein
VSRRSCRLRGASDSYAGGAHHHLDKPLQLVLSVLYRKRARSFYDGQDAGSLGVFDPRWTISIFAIGREVRHAVKTSLLTEGLPNILRPWLMDMASVTSKTGECGLLLHYDVPIGALNETASCALLPDRS